MLTRYLPRRDRWIYYGGLAALAAIGLVDWPLALVIAGGHLLADSATDGRLRELGEALEAV